MKNLLKVTLVAAATFALAPTAAGQSLAPGFALQRYYPAEVGSDWFAVDSLDLRGSGRPAAGLVLDYGHKPLVLRDADGNQLIAPIEHQLFAHLGAAVNVADRLRFALSVPIALVNTGTPAIFDDVLYQASEGVSLGDIRLAVDLGLFGSYGDPFRIALGVQTFLPTGGRSSYTGDGKVRIAPHLSIAGDVGVFVYAIQGAFAGRLLDEPFGGQPLGNGIRFAGAAGVRVADGRVLLGPELHGETSVNGDYTFKGPTTPLEILLGAHIAATDAWRIGLGAGHAFTSAAGSPDVRLLFALTYFMPLPAPPPPPPPPPAPVAPPPPPPPADEDKDGVPDSADDCPKDAGLPALKGCPDGDGDGIADKVDACPKEAGPAHDDPAKNGCPAPVDTDKDGIVDPSDACPDRYGDPDPDPAKNGCPKVTVLKGEIKILERIEFDTGKSTLRPESGPLLTAIKRALVEHPEIKKVRLEGYTDSRGGAAFNLKLSQARVDAVMQWLIKEGIEPARMTAKGFGKASPIAPNNTEEGRQSNRRVQIVILE